MNKKGLVVNEVIWIVKLVLLFTLLGMVLVLGGQSLGFNILGYFSRGISALGQNIGAFAFP